MKVMVLGRTFTMRHFFALAVMSCLVWIVYSHSQEGETFFGHYDEDKCFGSECKQTENVIEQNTDDKQRADPEEIHVVITFANAENNKKFQDKFSVTVGSIFHYATLPLAIYIIGEPASHKIASSIMKNNAGEAKYRVVDLDVDKLAENLDEIVKPMQRHFSYKPGAYYSHALFFLSIAIHRVFSETIDTVIMLDADLKFEDDIKKLHDRFRLFKKDHVIGLAREQQPVYRHTFWSYRQKNAGTRVGGPPPDGLTGFNSGVTLLNLKAMRQSELYNSLLNDEAVKRLTEEFSFKGHLGDQDLFTLINMKYEWLFHVLPCVWNRQLCTWWNDHGYKDVFDEYHTCEGDIKIWHGNCDTPIP